MTIALLNSTPIVGKLVDRLAKKRGDVYIEGVREDGGQADIVIVDDSVGAQYGAGDAREAGRYTLYIGSRFEAMPEGYDAVLGKPFLPDELGRALDDAELAVRSQAGQNDIYDADEAAESLTHAPVFDPVEIDELKELLDAVETDDAFPDEEEASLQQRIESALEQLDERAWDQPIEEVLYDAGAPQERAETANRFDDIDLHARGVEALQDLMAILSDESVAQALKEMGVRIDISFGEKA